MTLFAAWSEIVADWAPSFPQSRTFRRATRQALGALVCVGRRCLSRIIWTQGRQQRSWSSEYFLHSRCRWEPQTLFAGVWRRALPYCPGRLVGVAVDDTRLRKTGRAIPQARYHRDPLSPPFHVNLMYGLRFLQASLLLPLHRRGNASCRALPVRFEEAAPVKKPSRKAGEEAWQEYKKMRKLHNLSQRLVQIVAPLRRALDAAGGTAKLLVLALDGSFCNRTCFRAPRDRTELIARTRKDARLCFRAPQPSRRFYALSTFTPEQVRQDAAHSWKQTKLFYGGKRRRIRYKEVTQVYWRRGAGQIPLRLFVVAPTPYRKRKSSKLYYRQPAYLLSTDLSTPLPSCCKSTSTAGRSKSTTATRRILWGWDKPSCGTSTRYPNSPPWWSPPTAPCSWPLSKPSAPHVASLIRPCPSGDARPTALPASTSSPCCGKKWSTTPNAPNPSASNLPTATSPSPLTLEKCRNSWHGHLARVRSWPGWPCHFPNDTTYPKLSSGPNGRGDL